MKMSKLKVEDLEQGQVLLTNVRKVHNTDEKSTGTNYKVQIECAEFVNNEFREMNALSLLNASDSRFVGNKPRFGWLTVAPKEFEKFFGKLVSLKEVEALEFSSGEDNVAPENRIEGTHYIQMGILNPEIAGQRLHVRITEGLIRRNDKQPSKVNPKTNEPQTVNGAPIYVDSTIDFADQDHLFLLSDQMKVAISQGTLRVSAKALRAYNEKIALLGSIQQTATQRTEREPAHAGDPTSGF